MIHTNGSHFIAQQQDHIERLHRRLHLFLGDVWAEQLIIALHNCSMRGSQSYVELLEQAVDMVIKSETWH